jgi:disulfide bond formation protein DsbB
MSDLSQRVAFILLIGFAIISLSASLYAETMLGFHPCSLCWIQRGYHALLLPASLLGIFSQFARHARRACQLLLLISCLTACYHVLVQFRLVQDRCKTGHAIGTIESFETLLLEKQESTSSCSESSWKILGIPVAAINSFASFSLFWLLCLSKISLSSVRERKLRDEMESVY